MSADTTPTTSPAAVLSPELLRTVADAIGTALAKQPMEATEQTDTPGQTSTPAQAGVAIGTALAPLAAPVLAKAQNKLKSRKLWTALGAITVLAAQNPLGLSLPPAAQIGIAAVAAIYVAAQAIVDSASKQGGGQ